MEQNTATDLVRTLAAAASMVETTGLTLNQAAITVRSRYTNGDPYVSIDLSVDAAPTEDGRMALLHAVAERVIVEESRYDWDYSYDSGMRLAGADGDTSDGIRVEVRTTARPASRERVSA